MSAMTNHAKTEARVLHINDSAFTTTVLLREACRRDLPWSYQPLIVADPSWRGVSRSARRAYRGVPWAISLGYRAAQVDLLHVHGATVVRHTGWVPRPYVLHLHGTDIRSFQYDPRYAKLVARAVDRAAAVLYSTPDLAEHAHRRRPDASLLSVPIDVASLPSWQPGGQPTVFFSSRWEPVKGLDVQLAIVGALRRRHGPDLRLVGIDWGIGASAARALGVELHPRSSNEAFLDLLSRSTVVMGQPTGMLAASELEAVGIGVPVVAPLRPDWYMSGGSSRAPEPPVLGGLAIGAAHRLPEQDATYLPDNPASDDLVDLAEALAAAASVALDDPRAASRRADGRAWLESTHGSAVAVDQLLELYGALLEGRRPFGRMPHPTAERP